MYLLVFVYVLVASVAFAQKPVVDSYRIKVLTKAGQHFHGFLSDVTETYLNLSTDKRIGGVKIPFANIRKIVLRRNSKKSAMITGAIIGGLATGFAANQSLQTNQARTSLTYGLTLTFAAAGGAAAGLLVGSGIGNLKKIVIRPLRFDNPERSLFRQLEPFSRRYQQELINQLPQNESME